MYRYQSAILATILFGSLTSFAHTTPSNEPQMCLEELFGAPVSYDGNYVCETNQVSALEEEFDGAKGVHTKRHKLYEFAVIATAPIYGTIGASLDDDDAPAPLITKYKCGGRDKATQAEFRSLKSEFATLKLKGVVLTEPNFMGTLVYDDINWVGALDYIHGVYEPVGNPIKYLPADAAYAADPTPQTKVRVVNGILYITQQYANFVSAESPTVVAGKLCSFTIGTQTVFSWALNDTGLIANSKVSSQGE